jgi:EF hand domain-containing protein
MTHPHTLVLAALAAFALAAPAGAEAMKPGQHFIENWDFDGDSKVSLDEATERRVDIFTTFDADEDGTLSNEEYDLFDEARANDMETMAEAQGGKAGGGMGGYTRSMERGVSDLDGDGVVTRAEFVDGTTSWFAMRDRNQDGFITLADFGRNGG